MEEFRPPEEGLHLTSEQVQIVHDMLGNTAEAVTVMGDTLKVFGLLGFIPEKVLGDAESSLYAVAEFIDPERHAQAVAVKAEVLKRIAGRDGVN